MCPLVCILDTVFWYGWLTGTHKAKVPCMAKYDLYITYPRERQALRWEIGLRGKGLSLWRRMFLPLLGLWGWVFLRGRGLSPLPPGIGKTLVWKPKSSNDTPSFISEIIQLIFPLYSFGNVCLSGKKSLASFFSPQNTDSWALLQTCIIRISGTWAILMTFLEELPLIHTKYKSHCPGI